MSGARDADGLMSGDARGFGFFERDVERLMRLVELGWLRHLPPAAGLMLEGIGDVPRVAVEELVDRECGQEIWEEPLDGGESRDPDADLQIAAALHPEVRDRAELERLSVQDRAEAAVGLRTRQDRFSRVCSALGIAEPKTVDEIYPFLLAVGVVEEYRRGSAIWVRSLAAEMDPIDVLRLDEQAAAEERACRGEMRFMPIGATIAEQFRAVGGRNGRLVTSLLRLARLAGLPVEQVRFCLTGGLDAGILTCSRDLGALEQHRVFELRISASRGEAVQQFTTHYRLAA